MISSYLIHMIMSKIIFVIVLIVAYLACAEPYRMHVYSSGNIQNTKQEKSLRYSQSAILHYD